MAFEPVDADRERHRCRRAWRPRSPSRPGPSLPPCGRPPPVRAGAGSGRAPPGPASARTSAVVGVRRGGARGEPGVAGTQGVLGRVLGGRRRKVVAADRRLHRRDDHSSPARLRRRRPRPGRPRWPPPPRPGRPPRRTRLHRPPSRAPARSGPAARGPPGARRRSPLAAACAASRAERRSHRTRRPPRAPRRAPSAYRCRPDRRAGTAPRRGARG